MADGAGAGGGMAPEGDPSGSGPRPRRPPLTRLDGAVADIAAAANPRARRLNLSHNAIAAAADDGSLARFAALTFLNLSYNRLRALDRPFGLLTGLHALDVSHNEL